MAKILIAFDTLREGFEPLRAKHQLIMPPAGRDFTKEEIIEQIKDCDVLCSVFDITIDREIIDAAPQLKLIANYAVGYNNIDCQYARSKDITVTNTPRSVVEPTADLAMALLLSCSRRVAEWDRAIRQEGNELDRSRLARLGTDLWGKTLGVVGYGNIGEALARRCKAFGMKVIYNKRNRYEPTVEAEKGISYRDLEQLIAEADVLSLHTPLTAESHHLIGAKEFAKMKPSAILINTARGPVVEEAALIEALKSGQIAAAGLDVFEHNDTPSPALFELENLSMTPHVGTQTRDARLEMVQELLDNVLGFLQKDRPISIVN